MNGEPDTDLRIFSEKLENLADGQLAKHWKAGDEDAATVLVQRYFERLVALIGVRWSQKYQDDSGPEDVVQSALASFFCAVRQSKVQVSQAVSLWQLLATFAKRKMIRSIEKKSALKRSGSLQRIDLNQWQGLVASPSSSDFESLAENLVEQWKDQLSIELHQMFELLLAGFSQEEIAERLEVSARTVRRHVAKIRNSLEPDSSKKNAEQITAAKERTPELDLPKVDFCELKLKRMIGEGGFGKVYCSVWNDKNSEPFAVKFLKKGFWKDSVVKNLFLEEIFKTSMIKSDSVVKTLGWGETKSGAIFVVMKFIDGKPLYSFKTLAAKEFRLVLKQLCQIVWEIHFHGLVHGDLTPANILVEKSTGKLWITDFGFATFAKKLKDGPQKGSQILGGTLGFAAPEQISSSMGEISSATDIYSIGGLAYWYLTGRTPNESSTTAEAIANTLSEKELLIESEQSLDRQKIREVAVLALRKSVAERPLTALALANLLE